MKPEKKPDPVWLYALGVLLALAVRLIDHKTANYTLSTLCFGVVLLLDAGMLLAWLYSVRRRLLHSRARGCIVAAVMLFLFFLAISALSYRIAPDSDLAFRRMCWYLYYVPLLFVPTLFLILCLDIVPASRAKKNAAALCFVPSAALTATVLTNDLHYLVFSPVDPAWFSPADGYTRRPLYYAGLAFAAGVMLWGCVRLAWQLKKRRRLFAVFIPLAFMLLYQPISVIPAVLFRARILHMPQFCIFCMVCFFECCIRLRLIPYNENYAAFFGGMRLPAVITDRALEPVFATSQPVSASPEQFVKSLEAPVYLTRDLRLSGRPLKAGNVFYTEDETELHRMNDRLAEANELLDGENELIRAENELREQRARVEARSRIYARISQKTAARGRQAAELLRQAQPGTPGFRDTVAKVSVQNVFMKRAANLLLVNEGEACVDVRELALAMEESARYMASLGADVHVTLHEQGLLPRDTVYALYETFQTLMETMLPGAVRVNAAVLQNGIRLVTNGRVPAALPETPLPAAVRESEGLVYYTVPAGKGGAV